MEIFGSPIIVYRPFRCTNCFKCYEINIEEIDMEHYRTQAITLICPHCQNEHKAYCDPDIRPGDRIVRNDI